MKKSFAKPTLCLALVSILSCSSFVLAADNDKNKEGIVRGSYINLRAEPKFSSQIIGKKLRGSTYTIIYEQQDWQKVKFEDGSEGWIRKTLVESNNSAEVKDSKKENDTSKKVVNKEKADNKKEEVKKETSQEQPLIKPVNEDNLPEVVEFSGTAEELYNEAIKLYEKRKYAEALEKNKVANKKAPKNAEILNNIGNCQFKLGRIEDALDSWKEALKIAPRSGKICNNLGIAYYQLDKNKDAIEYYKKAILFEPDFADPYYNIASVYGFLGNFEEALYYYKKFLEFNPDDTVKSNFQRRIKKQP